MFKYLFNLSYGRGYEEALVFYACYFVFGYFIAGILMSCADFFYPINSYLSDFFFILIGFFPFIFYMSVASGIIIKKKLKWNKGIRFLFGVFILTFLIPLISGICSQFIFPMEDLKFQFVNFGAFMEMFFQSLALGGIPVAILTIKEDCSLKKELEKMEQEKLEHERYIEKQLLTERATKNKIEEIKKHVNIQEEEMDSERE